MSTMKKQIGIMSMLSAMAGIVSKDMPQAPVITKPRGSISRMDYSLYSRLPYYGKHTRKDCNQSHAYKSA